MRVTVHYMAQLKRAAGRPSDAVEVEGACTVADLLLLLVQNRADMFGRLILDSQGRPQPSLLVFVDDEQVPWDRRLRDGDSLTLLTPMAGG